MQAFIRLIIIVCLLQQQAISDVRKHIYNSEHQFLYGLFEKFFLEKGIYNWCSSVIWLFTIFDTDVVCSYAVILLFKYHTGQRSLRPYFFSLIVKQEALTHLKVQETFARTCESLLL